MFKFRTKKSATVLSAVEAGLYRHGNDDLIELRSVIKAYETAAGEFTALRGVNLQIECPGGLSELLESLDRHGVMPFLPLEDRWYRRGSTELGNRQVWIQDPDGYLLRFFEDLGQRSVAGEEPHL